MGELGATLLFSFLFFELGGVRRPCSLLCFLSWAYPCGRGREKEEGHKGKLSLSLKFLHVMLVSRTQGAQVVRAKGDEGGGRGVRFS